MSTQPIRKHDIQPINQSSESEWKILAEEAAQEQDPEKLLEIVRELTHALDEEEARHKKSA